MGLPRHPGASATTATLLRGLSITLRHVLHNALGPIVTNLGLDMAYFLDGVLVVDANGSPYHQTTADIWW